jgi:hypothetical protein
MFKSPTMRNPRLGTELLPYLHRIIGDGGDVSRYIGQLVGMLVIGTGTIHELR